MDLTVAPQKRILVTVYPLHSNAHETHIIYGQTHIMKQHGWANIKTQADIYKQTTVL